LKNIRLGDNLVATETDNDDDWENGGRIPT